jgi:hypothetical protein
MHRFTTPALSLGLALGLLCACAPTKQADDASLTNTPQREVATEAQSGALPDDRRTTLTARLVERPGAGRAAEIVDTAGTVIETLAPENFSQTLRVPDIANNSSQMISQNVTGTDIVAVSIQPGTGRTLLAVRGFLYAEVSTDLVFRLQPSRSGTRTPESVEPVYFDGPYPRDDGLGPRPHLDVSRVSFDEEGHLRIETSDASGGACQLVYDRAKVPQSCTWNAGESRRCPEGVTPK